MVRILRLGREMLLFIPAPCYFIRVKSDFVDSLYCCMRLCGFSGNVYSIQPSFIIFRTKSLKYPDTLLNPSLAASSDFDSGPLDRRDNISLLTDSAFDSAPDSAFDSAPNIGWI